MEHVSDPFSESFAIMIRNALFEKVKSDIERNISPTVSQLQYTVPVKNVINGILTLYKKKEELTKEQNKELISLLTIHLSGINDMVRTLEGNLNALKEIKNKTPDIYQLINETAEKLCSFHTDYINTKQNLYTLQIQELKYNMISEEQLINTVISSAGEYDKQRTTYT